MYGRRLKIIWIIAVVGALGNFFVKMLLGIYTLADVTLCFLVIIFLVVPALCSVLIRLINRFIYRKDIALNSATMLLPVRGMVTLEEALHKMSTKTGVVVWDVLVGCVMISLLGVFWVDDMTVTSLLRGLAISAAFMAVGHMLLYLFWKKRSFMKRMVRNSAKYFPDEVNEGYADAVSASLNEGILAYEKQLILTDKYIICTAEQDTKFIPVAVPRAKVTKFVFYYRTISGHTYSKTFGAIHYMRTYGVLSCLADGVTLVDLLLGAPYAAQKVLRILDYYQIPWIDRDAERQ